MARKFVAINKNELRYKIEKAWGTNTSRYAWPEITPQVEKDLKKCEFDCENVCDHNGSFGPIGLTGYVTLSNGFTFLGLAAGGDWEIPVFFIIYWDGFKLRGYIPTNGNPWNTTTKQAYGNSINNTDGKNLKKRYPAKYGLMTDEEADSNWDWQKFDPSLIEDDIKTRIVKRI